MLAERKGCKLGGDDRTYNTKRESCFKPGKIEHITLKEILA